MATSYTFNGQMFHVCRGREDLYIDEEYNSNAYHRWFFFGGLEHNFKKKNFIVIQLQLSAFSPHPSTPPQPNPPPSPTSTLPLDFVLVSFIVALVDPSPHYPVPTPLWLLLDCS